MARECAPRHGTRTDAESGVRASQAPTPTACPVASEHACHQPRSRDEWIAIPVPAPIDRQTFDRAREQLARHVARSWRHNTKDSYLQCCLLTCQHCGLAMVVVTYQATATLPVR